MTIHDANDQRKDYSAQGKTIYVLWNRFYCPVTSCSVFNWQRLKSLVLARNVKAEAYFKKLVHPASKYIYHTWEHPILNLRLTGSVLDVSVQKQRAFDIIRESEDVWKFRLEAEAKNDKNVHQKIV